MKWIERLASLVGLDMNNAPRPEIVELRNILDEGRQRKRTEAYDEALRLFDQALSRAHELKDRLAVPIIQLHRADVFIKQARWEDAEHLLTELERQARQANERAQLAYILTTFGTLSQARGTLGAARRYYEQGLETARGAKSAGAEGRALGHLADTYLLEGNASYAAHLLRECLQKLNSSNDMELTSYFVGRLGEALIAIGQAQEGDPLLDRALRLAQHMNYRAFERLWHLALARRDVVKGHYSDAYGHYERIVLMLPPESPDLNEVLREWAQVCLYLDKRDDALTHARRALSMAPDDPITKGMLGIVLNGTGYADEALPYLEAAVRESESHALPPKQLPEFLRTLGAAYAATHAADNAVTAYQRAQKVAKTLNDPIEEARALRDLGTFYANHQQAQLAIKIWTEAVGLYENLGLHSQVARLYCDIANLRMMIGASSRALKDYETALMALNSVQDQETRGIVLANVATAYVDQGDLETADAFFTESIKIAQKLMDKPAEAIRRGNYGWFLLATGRVARALPAIENALRQSEALHLSLPIAIQTDNLGLAHGELGQHDLALAHHRKAVALLRELQHMYWLGIALSNLAAELLKQQHDERQMLDEVTALVDEVQALGNKLDNLELKVRALNLRARVALRRDQAEIAGKLAQEAVLLARRVTARRLLAESLLVLSEQQARQGEMTKAAASWDESRRLFETLHHSRAKLSPAWLPRPQGV